MKSNTIAKMATLAIAGLAISMTACSHKKDEVKTSPVAAKANVQQPAAVEVAEAKMLTVGCKFEDVNLPQDQVVIDDRFACADGDLSAQKSAIGDYITALGQLEKGSPLQDRMDKAVTKFMEIDSAIRKEEAYKAATALPAVNHRADGAPEGVKEVMTKPYTYTN